MHFQECFGASSSVIMVFKGAHGVSAHQFHIKWCRLIVATSVDLYRHSIGTSERQIDSPRGAWKLQEKPTHIDMVCNSEATVRVILSSLHARGCGGSTAWSGPISGARAMTACAGTAPVGMTTSRRFRIPRPRTII